MISDTLKARREELGLNLGEAAEEFGVSRQAYTLWERGAYGTNLDADRLEQLSRFLGLSKRDTLVAIGWLGPDDDTGTVAGPSPRSPQRRNDTTLIEAADRFVQTRLEPVEMADEAVPA